MSYRPSVVPADFDRWPAQDQISFLQKMKNDGWQKKVLGDDQLYKDFLSLPVEDRSMLNRENYNNFGATILDGERSNTLYGTPLDDDMHGHGGNDTMHGGDGNDRLFGGTGNDILRGGKGDDVLLGEQGDDDIVDGEGLNVLSGGDGNDRIQGKGIFIGGRGNDTLVGSDYGDLYVFRRGDGSDTIEDIAGNDMLKFTGDITESQLWLTRKDGGLNISIIGTTDNVFIKRFHNPHTYIIDDIQVGNGKTLNYRQVDALVTEMAKFAPPPAGQTTLPDHYTAALKNIMAASWK